MLVDVVVEAWLGPVAGWTAMPVRAAAGGGGVRIRRDRKSGAALPDPGTATVVVDDSAGDWSPRNPRGQYFGLIGRNTPVRISADGGTSWRLVGEAAAWSPSWSTSAGDRVVTVEVAGVLRRLLASNAPSWSPLRRAIGAAGPVAYWPMEDGTASTQVASALPGHPAATVTGTPTFAAVADYSWGTLDFQTLRFGTGSVLDLKAGQSITAAVPADVTAATAAGFTAFVACLVEYDKVSGDVVLIDVATPGGTFIRWQLVHRVGGTLGYEVRAAAADGAVTSLCLESGAYLGFQQFTMSVWQDGGVIRAGVSDTSSGFIATGSTPGTLAGVTAVAVNPTGATSSGESMPFGHLALFASNRLPPALWLSAYDPVAGKTAYGPTYSYLFESALARLSRLCAEQGVPLTVPDAGTAAVTLMGWQAAGTWGDLVASAVDAEGGRLVEQRDGVGLVYRHRVALQNATPAVTLSYADGHIAPPLRPVDDDDQVVNDATVERVDGSSARAVVESGPLSVLPAPDGVGTYDTTVRLNLLYDDELPNRAWWAVHVGTAPESRYAGVTVDMAAPAVAGDPAVAAGVLSADAGDLVELVDLPDWLPPGPVLVLVDGYEEQIADATWSITFTGSPGSPWTVATADGDPRVPADGTTLAGAVTSSSTSLSITSTADNGPWTTDPADFPLDVLVTAPGAAGTGERITLSGITGGGLTQTATVSARAVNGVARGWPAGSLVDVADPAVAAL